MTQPGNESRSPGPLANTLPTFVYSPGDLRSIPGWVIPKTQKWHLMPPCLTLSNIREGSRVKWSNPGKGVAPSPTPQCSSYQKGSLQVTIDYGHQLYLLTIFIILLYQRRLFIVFLSAASTTSNYYYYEADCDSGLFLTIWVMAFKVNTSSWVIKMSFNKLQQLRWIRLKNMIYFYYQKMCFFVDKQCLWRSIL